MTEEEKNLFAEDDNSDSMDAEEEDISEDNDDQSAEDASELDESLDDGANEEDPIDGDDAADADDDKDLDEGSEDEESEDDESEDEDAEDDTNEESSDLIQRQKSLDDFHPESVVQEESLLSEDELNAELARREAIAKEQDDELERVHIKYVQAMNKVVDSEQAAREFMVATKCSPNQEINQLSRTETKKYDVTWIDNIDNAITALENIAKDPKKHIRLERYITPIELAKRITSESVMHLSSHSQYVKNIDKKGNVIPNKILTVTGEDEYGIYENRFVKTLIDRTLSFINKRYDYVTKHADTRDSDMLTMTNKVVVGDVTYDYETKIKISVPSADEGQKDVNERLLKRIELLRKRMQYVHSSFFYEQLKNCKPVSSPIMKTNIIVKNPNYRKAHILWKFIEKYDKLGITIHVKETSAKFNEVYVDELQKLMFTSFLSLQTNKKHEINFADVKAYKVKPKVGNRPLDKEYLDTKFDIEGQPRYGIAGRALTPKQKALKKRQEAARKAKLKMLEDRKIEREKARSLAKQKEEQRLAKLRAEKEAQETRDRIAREKAEAKRLEEEKIARQKAEEKAILDAEKEALARAREKAKRMAEEDRIRELKILRPNGLTPEEEEAKRLREEEEARAKAAEEERLAKIQALKDREEQRKKMMEEKVLQRKLSMEERREKALQEEQAREQARKEKLRAEILLQAQAKLKALREAELKLKLATALKLKQQKQKDQEEEDEDDEEDDVKFM